MKTLMLGFMMLGFINLASAQDKPTPWHVVWPREQCPGGCCTEELKEDGRTQTDHYVQKESNGFKYLYYKCSKGKFHKFEYLEPETVRRESTREESFRASISDADYKELWDELEAWQLQEIIDHTNPDGTICIYSKSKKGNKYGRLWKKLENESREVWHDYFSRRMNYAELQRIASNYASQKEKMRQEYNDKYSNQFQQQDRSSSSISRY